MSFHRPCVLLHASNLAVGGGVQVAAMTDRRIENLERPWCQRASRSFGELRWLADGYRG